MYKTAQNYPTTSLQIVGFNIRPLWDTAIPIELFLDNTTAANFRNYLANATATQLEIASSCLDSNGQNCTANNGTCVTNLNQQNGTYAVTCLPGPQPPFPVTHIPTSPANTRQGRTII